MKKLLILILVLIVSKSFAQDTEFKFSKEGITDFIVTNVDTSAKDLFAKTTTWIKENNKNLDAIKSTIENEKIVFQGYKENFSCTKAGGTNICSNANYTIEITFKDGKYKFDLLDMELIGANGKSSKPNLNDFSEYYDKDGNLKKYMGDIPATYEIFFNGLNKNLVTYIEKKLKSEKW
jgi:hypothetical protein